MIGPGLFHGLVSAASGMRSSVDKTHSSCGGSMTSESAGSLEKPAKRQHLIPPEVLVPLSMKASSSYSTPLSIEKDEERNNGVGIGGGSSSSKDHLGNGFSFVVPEGRVHGGGLMSLLGGNLRNGINEL